MIAQITPAPIATENAEADTQTIQVITPTALRCACQEYKLNRFCIHLVYLVAAKIQAHMEACANLKTKGGDDNSD